MDMRPTEDTPGRRMAIESAHVQDDMAALVEEKFDALIKAANGKRDGRGLMITGPAGSGKSHVIRRFRARKELAPYEMETGEGTARPIIFINAPSPCTMKALGSEILTELTGASPRPNLQSHMIWQRIRRQLIANRTQFLVIDEIHHVLQRKNDMEAENIAETFKNVMQNPDWPINLILGGMTKAHGLTRNNEQFGRRVDIVDIMPIADNAEGYSEIARYLERLVPRMEFSGEFTLHEGDMPLRFHRATGGYLGGVFNVVKTAAHMALDVDGSVITRTDLADAVKAIYKVATPGDNAFLVNDPSKLGKAIHIPHSRRTNLDGTGGDH